MNEPTMDAIARRFGVSVTVDAGDDRITWERDGVSVVTDDRFEPSNPSDRYRAACTAWGVRLGSDRLRGPYDFSEERPDSEGARNVYEMASIYGERLQQLVPTLALDLAETVADVPLFRRPWLDDAVDAELVLIRETRRWFHTFAEPDFDRLEYTRDNIVEYARYALFYDAYKFRPEHTDRHAWGRLKWFATRDGQASSRATLLPDFDYDAARARGALALIDRDRFVIAQPGDDRDRTLNELHARAAAALHETPLPFSPRVLHLGPDAVEPGELLDGCASFDTSRIKPLEVRDSSAEGP